MNHTVVTNMVNDKLSSLAAAARGTALALLLAVPVFGFAAGQKTFADPEAAVSALIDACKADDDAALIAIFGDQHKSLVVTPDKAENSALRAQTVKALEAFHRLQAADANRSILLMGDQAWPLPIPLVRENGAWRFATELGEDELINRRIGANEREALEVLRAYIGAQRQYAAKDRNGDGVLEYAQKMGSTPGKQDGLYWPADETKGEEASPFGPLMAEAAAYLKGHHSGDPYRGYYFRILTRQGKAAPGGAYNYVINGRLIAGFALLAYPADYGVTGVMSFIVSHNGQVFEKNLGAQTEKAAQAIKEFNPDASWKKVADPS